MNIGVVVTLSLAIFSALWKWVALPIHHKIKEHNQVLADARMEKIVSQICEKMDENMTELKSRIDEQDLQIKELGINLELNNRGTLISLKQDILEFLEKIKKLDSVPMEIYNNFVSNLRTWEKMQPSEKDLVQKLLEELKKIPIKEGF